LNNQGAILTQNGGHLFCVKIRKVEKHNQTYQNKNTVWSTTKIQKSLATEVSPTVFAMPKESRKSVMMPVALQASQSELSTFCSI